jgi:hypothetical protein
VSHHPGSSVQAQWVAREQHPLRQAFPGFAAIFDGLVRTCRLICELLAYQRVALLTTAVGWVAVSLVVSLLSGLIDSGGDVQYRMVLLPLVFIAQSGVWSSVGQGAWHYRLPLAMIAAAWLVAAHASAIYWCGNALLYGGGAFPTILLVAITTFSCSAFAAAWFRSITGQELRGPEPASSTLLPGQFNIGAILWATLLVAALLGLWQASLPWSDNLHLNLRRLEWDPDARLRIEVASGAALLALLAGFRRWPAALAVTLGGLTVLAACDYWGLSAPPPPWSKRFMLGLCWPTGLFLVPALATVAWLRWLGFRLERTAT